MIQIACNMRHFYGWSPSMRLFRYLFCRISISKLFSLFTALIPAVFDPLLSIFIFLGTPLLLMAFFKNFVAAFLSRLARSKKSMVFPSVSTARYKYAHFPLTFLYVSFIRQPLPTFFFRFLYSELKTSENLITQRCNVA